MTTLFIFAAIIAALVFAFRWQRRREIAAFLEADVGDLRAALGKDRSPATLTAGAGGTMPAVSPAAVVGEIAGRGVDAPPRSGAPAAEEGGFELRPELFDDVIRSLLTALEEILDERFRAFIKVPAQEMVRRRGDGPPRIPPAIMISAVICRREDFAPLCGIQLHDGSERSHRDLETLTNLFREIGRPLVSLPLATDYSPLELRERLGDLIDPAA